MFDKYINDYNYNNYKYIDLDKVYYDDSEQWELKNKLTKRAKIAHICQIVTSSPDNNIIGTTALDTCYGIVFYDRKNKFGMVGHALPSKKIDIVASMIEKLGDESREIEYAIVSGYRNLERGDYSGEDQIKNFLESYCPKNISFIPLNFYLDIRVCSNVLAYEFAFDVNTTRPVTNELFYEGDKSFQKSIFRY